MDKEYEAFLNKYIPSADMRAKIIEVGHQFSDWDRAAIIWNSDFPLYEKHEEIILDDDPELFDQREKTPHLYLTSCKTGLTDTDVTKIMKQIKQGL